jgi:sensor histidine kinase YesM
VNLFALASSVIASGIVSDLMGTEMQSLYSDKEFYRFATIIISKLILITGGYVLFKNNMVKIIDIKKPEWILAASVFSITFVLFAFIRSAKLMIEPNSKPQTFLSVAEYGLVFINIICIFVIRKLNVLNVIEKENIVLKQQSEFNRQCAERIKSEERELTRVRHDFKQSIAVIKGLLSERNLDKLENYLAEYEKSYTISDSRTYTKNEFVNSILNVKLYYAKRIGVETFCSMINSFGNINDVDLCNLIGNMLDNAIEGSLSTEPETKLVEINISNNGKNVVVRVENTIGTSVIDTNPNLNTSKKDSGEHGYGIKNIKSICKKYRGDFDYYENKGMFCCIAILRCDLGNI